MSATSKRERWQTHLSGHDYVPIHVHGSTKVAHEVENRLGDTSTGFDALHGDRKGGGGTCASQGRSLGGNDIFEVGKGVTLGGEPQKANIHHCKVRDESTPGGDNEPSDISKGSLQVTLTGNGLDNEGEYGERSDHDDPVDAVECYLECVAISPRTTLLDAISGGCHTTTGTSGRRK